MSSQDIYIVIDGQEYQISGNGKSRSEIQSAVIDKLDSIEYRIGRIEQELEIMEHDQSALQTSVYWVLAGIGIFIAPLIIILLGVSRKIMQSLYLHSQ